MKIILITSTRDEMDRRTIKIAKSLNKNGYKPHILTWDRKGIRPETENVDGCIITNFRLAISDDHKLAIICGYFIWWIYVILFLLKKDADVYQPENLFSFIPVIAVRIVKRKKIVYDIADFTANSFNWPGKTIKQIMTQLENFCLRIPNGVIIVDENRKMELNESNIKELAIVMNCPMETKKKSKQKDSDNFTIYCGGLLSNMRGLEQICKAINGLLDVKLVIAGSGPYEKNIKLICEKQKNVEFRGLLTSEESLEFTNRSDVIFAFYDPKLPLNRLASPNKLFDAMMCSTPIIANSEALPMANIIKRENCGLLTPYNDIKGINEAIKRLKNNSKERLEMGENGRIAFRREYNWKIMEKRLIELYSKIQCL